MEINSPLNEFIGDTQRICHLSRKKKFTAELTQEMPVTSVRFRTFLDIFGQKIQRGPKTLKMARK